MANEKRLIDANVLWDEVDKSKHNNPHSPGMVRVNHRNEHDHFLRMICDAPTVDAVEVVHGRWKLIQLSTPDGWRNSKTGEKVFPMCCSVCGDAYMNGPYKYCPSCGAKMDGGAGDG